jgi:hypothetical protein
MTPYTNFQYTRNLTTSTNFILPTSTAINFEYQ